MKDMVEEQQPQILVVEDNQAVVRVVQRVLEINGYRVIVASDGVEALEKFEATKPDLILLDIGIPELDGIEVCRRIRKQSNVAIIMVTGRDSDEDVLLGLEAGADDYVSKPFNAGVLAARVSTVLRRTQTLGPTSSHGRYTCGGLIVDFDSHRVLRDSQEFHITPTEYRLLSVLVQHVGAVVSSETLLIEVWGAEYAGETQILRTHINRLRKKVEPDSETPIYIRTRPGAGYRLDCPASD